MFEFLKRISISMTLDIFGRKFYSSMHCSSYIQIETKPKEYKFDKNLLLEYKLLETNVENSKSCINNSLIIIFFTDLFNNWLCLQESLANQTYVCHQILETYTKHANFNLIPANAFIKFSLSYLNSL